MSSNLWNTNVLGWVLIHSIWQFALVGMVAGLLGLGIRREAARLRYGVLLTAILGMLVSVFVTWVWQATSVPAGRIAEMPMASTSLTDFGPAAETSQPLVETESMAAMAEPASSPDLVPFRGSNIDAGVSVSTSWWLMLEEWCVPWLDSIVSLWCIGVVCFSIRPALGIWTTQRLGREKINSIAPPIRVVFDSLIKRMGIVRKVKLLESDLVKSPIVIGCFRSAILVPTGFVCSVPVSQVEAILAHELAHVRRYDYLINLLQTLIETCFFYHPAVWWISHQIRIERENCCDDEVVAILDNRVEYGRALLAIEEHRSSLGLALGANQGSLMYRVRRLFDQQRGVQHRSPGLSIAGLLLGIVGTLGVWAMLRSPARAEGVVTDGIRFELVVLDPSVEDDQPNLADVQQQFASCQELTFGVQMTNVSDRPISLAGVRYGDGFAENTQGKLRTERMGPRFFDFEIFDGEGKPLRRPSRKFFDAWHLDRSASIHELAPGESLTEVLRPAKFHHPMNLELAAGKYSARVSYRGLSDEARGKIVEFVTPQHAILQTFSGSIQSNKVEFTLASDPDRTPPEQLVWGPVTRGLQAAMEFTLPEQSGASALRKPGVEVGTKIGVIFHVKNVSDNPITFISESGRQGDQPQVMDSQGQEVTVGSVFYTGWPIDILWSLQPGEAAQLQVLAPGINSIDQPGQYRIRYTIRFNSRIQRDKDGNVVFPRPGDFNGELVTGETPLFLYREEPSVSKTGEIRGQLKDYLKDAAIRGATVACRAVVNDSGTNQKVTAKTDSLGNYRLVVPSPGIYHVWLESLPNRGRLYAPTDAAVIVEAGKVARSQLWQSNGRWVSGTVTDSDGKPLQYVVVNCYSDAIKHLPAPPRMRTDEEGRFTFAVPPGRVYLDAARGSDSESTTQWYAGVSVDVTNDRHREDIVLKLQELDRSEVGEQWIASTTTGSKIKRRSNQPGVSGFVRDTDGNPIAEAIVCYSPSAQPTKTGEDGSFQVPFPGQAPNTLTIVHPDFRVWAGRPSGGEELVIVLDKASDSVALPSSGAGAIPSNRSESQNNVSTPWRVFGKVVDQRGQPLAGVTVRSATGIGTLVGGSSAVTDAEGRYDFRFGMGIRRASDDDKPSKQTQVALISATLAGYSEKNFNRQGRAIASLLPLDAEELQRWSMNEDQVFLPGKPLEFHFEMVPAAKVSGSLIGPDDQPLADYSVSLTGGTLPPGSSVLNQVRTDDQGRFMIDSIPMQTKYHFQVRKPRSELKPPWQDAWASGWIEFMDPGEHELHARLIDPKGKSEVVMAQNFQLKLVGSGIGRRRAAELAASKDWRAQLSPNEPSSGENPLPSLQMLLGNP